MQYFIAFLEGIITFISPCLLPMLPLYISYFAGGKLDGKKGKALKNALGFVLGFTILFTLMGAFAGTVGSFFKKYQIAVNVISGIIIILFGLNFLGVLKLNLFKGTKRQADTKDLGFLSSAVFGMVFSISWTPCVGAFLGSALMMAANKGSFLGGIVMLLCYSAGLGIPFVISAILIDKLKSTFDFIKRHYGVINKICGGVLVLVGIMTATGTIGYLMGLLS